MRCYCGGGEQCFCRLNFVIYKLKCKKCFQSYIGKTVRQLWIRISEHLRGVINGKGSALARHPCRHDYELRVLARSENNKNALRIMEGKMMNKYKPKINIKNEKSARELAEKMGKLLRNKDSCKPDDKPQRDDNIDDDEDQCEYWIESSDWYSSEVECENEDGNEDVRMSETEASKKMDGEQEVIFNANNYALLAASKVHEHSKPFVTLALNSNEAKEMGIYERVPRSLLEKIWYATPVGIWFDDERTLKEKFVNLGINVAVVAVSVVVPLGIAAAIGGRAAATAGTAAATVAAETGATAVAAGTTAVAAGTTMIVAKLAVKTAACGAAFVVPGLGAAAPTICVMA
uniref:GIY-YIG domain-containing protein n=1 Tax=Plectus sambesii TaxID=2011161 RepID=A0A914VCY9_9BILA